MPARCVAAAVGGVALVSGMEKKTFRYRARIAPRAGGDKGREAHLQLARELSGFVARDLSRKIVQ